jgi:hydrogenase/urease accessory protein HupE
VKKPFSGFRSQASGFGLLLALALFAPLVARAHGLVFTRVEAMFARPGEVDITIDYNLALVLPQPAAYYPLTQSSVETQTAAVQRALPRILAAMEFWAGGQRLVLELQSFALPKLPPDAFNDPAQDKSAELRFIARLPPPPAPLVMVVPYGADVEHPVLFAAGTPANGVLQRSWVEEGPSEEFDWSQLKVGATANGSNAAGAETRPPRLRPPWYVDFWTYLRLGFKHIVPDGLDHILFVLALFFLGQTWRKLVAQTTVFTIAHATTLFLSRYGVFSLPGKYVEPLIAFSIACIALENIWRPKLGPARLALVFAFGLVHGLGFAGSLSEVEFPRDQFVMALLGFNLGVDFGQLCIIALALLAVGWWRDRPWFRARVMIPCCAAIAATGLYWTVERIFS